MGSIGIPNAVYHIAMATSMKILALMLLLATPVLAGGPKYSYKDQPLLDDEVQNIYHDIRNVFSGTIPSVKISTITLVSSATITNLTVGTLTTSGTLGRIKQIAQFTTTTTSSTVSATQIASNLTISITPTSTGSTIFVFMSGLAVTNAAGSLAQISMKRGATDLSGGNLFSSFGSSAGTARNNVTIMWPDNPNTTSATTYTLTFASSDGNSVTFGNGQEQVAFLVEYL